MRVFLCEFVTGGGMAGAALPPSLAREGALMRDALARDLAALPGVTVVTCHDARFPPPDGVDSRAATSETDFWIICRALAEDADVAWPVAPETDGLFRRLVALCRAASAETIAPDDETIRIASSKRATAEQLAAQSVATPPVWRTDAPLRDARGPFVTKPDDGAGCEATRLWDAWPDPGAVPHNHVIQSFVPGEAASLTVLRAGGETRLLAANRQFVSVTDGAFAFAGVLVGALPAEPFAPVAEAVCGALPGLAGIFGIDLVLSPDGPVVIEVNPRLTTSYAGLRAAIGVNPASLMPPFAKTAPPRRLARNPVEVRV